MSDGFSPEQLLQLEAIVEKGVRKGFADIGFKTDDEHKEETADTVRFLFHIKRMWDSAVSRIGSAVMTAVIGIVFAVIGLGFWSWLGRGPS